METGLDLSRSRRPRGENGLGNALVRDVLDLKPSYGLDHDPGVVLILDSFTVEAPESLIGSPARIQAPAGRAWDVTIDEVKDHGVTVSLFIKNLTSRELPIGSLVSLDLGWCEGRSAYRAGVLQILKQPMPSRSNRGLFGYVS